MTQFVFEPTPGRVYWRGDLTFCEECRLDDDTYTIFVMGAPIRCRLCRRLILSATEATADARVKGMP